MEDIGRQLREAREKLGLTLDEVERATRIRSHHLEALERGDLSALPSFVQARGFLHNYAEFLGLDAEELMLRYADAVQTRSGRGRVPRTSEDPSRSYSMPRQPGRLRRWLSADLFISVALVLTVLVVLVWGASRLMNVMRQQTEAASRPALGSLVSPTASPTASPTPTSAVIAAGRPSEPAATTEATLEPLIVPGSGVQLRILGEKRAWISVQVDGKEKFTGLINTGDILEYQAQDVVEIATGNAGGVRVFFNGQDQGSMGDVGQAIIRLWTRDGMVTPTPTESPTPTQSVTPSRTPIPSATPRPTRTPVASPVPLGG